MSAIEIRIDDPRNGPITALLREHLHSMTLNAPPESSHALDIDGLCKPDVTFWAAWRADDLLGCGALLELTPAHGEIKSMRTAAPYLRQGVAAALLERMVMEARQRGYERLSLETGSMASFAPARALYARFGFVECGPFGSYVLDPYSVFMTRTL